MRFLLTKLVAKTEQKPYCVSHGFRAGWHRWSIRFWRRFGTPHSDTHHPCYCRSKQSQWSQSISDPSVTSLPTRATDHPHGPSRGRGLAGQGQAWNMQDTRPISHTDFNKTTTSNVRAPKISVNLSISNSRSVLQAPASAVLFPTERCRGSQPQRSHPSSSTSKAVAR